MKKILNLILIIFIVSSCSKNKYEKQLIGQWNNFPIGGRTNITFYKDSIVSYEYSGQKRVGTWKADSEKIHIHYLKKIKGYRKKYTLFYKMSNDKDSLFTRLDTDSIRKNIVLLRVKDNWKHYLRKLKMEINLPEADFKLVKNDSMDFGVNLYITQKNGKLIIKSDYVTQFNNSEILDNIEPFIYSQRAIRKESEVDKIYFNLIIDKNIKQKTIDSIKTILKKFPEMKVFRVYKNDSANYGKYDLTNTGEFWNWYGRFE